MRIGIASDHCGLKLKEEAISYLQLWGFEVQDFGTNTEEVCDYPRFAYLLAKAVACGKVNRGILISDTGTGMTIVANKIKGVRAANCYGWKDAVVSRQRYATNIICMGEDVDIWQIMDSWLNVEFDDKNSERIDQISQIEEVE